MITTTSFTQDPGGMKQIFLRRTPFKIIDTIVGLYSVFVVRFMTMIGGKRLQDESMHINAEILAMLSEPHAQVPISGHMRLKNFPSARPHGVGTSHDSPIGRGKIKQLKSKGWFPDFHSAYYTNNALVNVRG